MENGWEGRCRILPRGHRKSYMSQGSSWPLGTRTGDSSSLYSSCLYLHIVVDMTRGSEGSTWSQLTNPRGKGRRPSQSRNGFVSNLNQQPWNPVCWCSVITGPSVPGSSGYWWRIWFLETEGLEPWAGHLTSLWLCLLICKMGTSVVPTLWSCCEIK